MKIQRKRILLVVFILSLFSLSSIMVPLTFGLNYNQQLMTTNSGSYSDTFLSTTFKDSSSTAFGWGSGTVTKARDFSLDILDYYYHVRLPVFQAICIIDSVIPVIAESITCIFNFHRDSRRNYRGQEWDSDIHDTSGT